MMLYMVLQLSAILTYLLKRVIRILSLFQIQILGAHLTFYYRNVMSGFIYANY